MNKHTLKDSSPHTTSQKVTSTYFKFRPWMAAAASFIIVLGLGASLHLIRNDSSTDTQSIVLSAPMENQPTGMRKFLNYNDCRYIFLEEVPPVPLKSTDLVKQLGTLDTQLTYDETSNLTQNFASTFAIGSAVWEVSQYDPAYRIVVAFEDQYYLCENVGRSDDGPFDIGQFFEAADFYDRARNTQLSYRINSEFIGLLSQSQTIALLKSIGDSQYLPCADIDFETLFQGESQGSSITLNVTLDDQTTLEMFVTPSQKIISIGDNYYQISDECLTLLQSFLP